MGRLLRMVVLSMILLSFPAVALSQTPDPEGGQLAPERPDPELTPPADSGDQRTTILREPLPSGTDAASVCGDPQGGGWVCVEPGERSTSTAEDEQSSAEDEGSSERAKPRARAAASYSFYRSNTVYYGIGSRQIGYLQHGRSLNFNGRQGQLAQSGNVLDGPAVRYDFQETIYRGTNHRVADKFRVIRPTGGRFTVGYVLQPTWYPYHRGNQYHAHFGLSFRASGVSNPGSPSGVFRAPQTNTPYYYCGSGRCRFP